MPVVHYKFTVSLMKHNSHSTGLVQIPESPTKKNRLIYFQNRKSEHLQTYSCLPSITYNISNLINLSIPVGHPKPENSKSRGTIGLGTCQNANNWFKSSKWHVIGLSLSAPQWHYKTGHYTHGMIHTNHFACTETIINLRLILTLTHITLIILVSIQILWLGLKRTPLLTHCQRPNHMMWQKVGSYGPTMDLQHFYVYKSFCHESWESLRK